MALTLPGLSGDLCLSLSRVTRLQHAVAVAGGWEQVADLIGVHPGAIRNYRALSKELTPEQRARVITAIVDAIAHDEHHRTP